MKKALQGFWRGGLLGGLLGLLGGVVYGIGYFLYLAFMDGTRVVISTNFTVFEDIFFIQKFTALPGLYYGFAIGVILGVPSILFYDQWKVWLRIIISVVGTSLLHLVAVWAVFWIDKYFLFFDAYREMLHILPFLLIVATLYGYYFPSFKPRWPKFLCKKQPQTE